MYAFQTLTADGLGVGEGRGKRVQKEEGCLGGAPASTNDIEENLRNKGDFRAEGGGGWEWASVCLGMEIVCLGTEGEWEGD